MKATPCARCGVIRKGTVPAVCYDCRLVVLDLGEGDLWGVEPRHERTAPPPRWRTDNVCGTPAGPGRHRRRGEPMCQPCLDVRSAQARERRARKKEAA